MALGGLLSRLAGSFGFGGGGNQPPQAGPQPQQLGPGMPNYAHQMGYRGGMQNPEAAMMAQRYGGGQAGYQGMGGPRTTAIQNRNQMIQDFNGTFPDASQDPSVLQDMAPQPARPVQPGMQNDIDRMMMSNDLGRMIPPGNSSPQANTQIGGAMGNNQGYDDLMGGQGGFSNKMPNQGYGDLMGGQGGFAENPFSKQAGYNGMETTMGNLRDLAPQDYAKYGGNATTMGNLRDSKPMFSGAYQAPSWGGKAGFGGEGGAGVIERAGSMMNPSLGGKGGFSMTKGAGIASNLGDMAKRFKPMSKGGYSIGEMFKPGGMTNKLLGKSGKVGAAISGAPAWAMPAAGAAAFGVKHIMKRSKQKKHQKQQNAQRDQIKNAAANGQYMQGSPGNFSGPQNF